MNEVDGAESLYVELGDPPIVPAIDKRTNEFDRRLLLTIFLHGFKILKDKFKLNLLIELE
jgi:hypothetical protein